MRFFVFVTNFFLIGAAVCSVSTAASRVFSASMRSESDAPFVGE
jgi:hypothetical protein